MLSCQEEASYCAYVEWLAEYLFRTHIQIPVSQLDTLRKFEKDGVDAAVLHLSDALGYTLWEVDLIEQEINAGVSYAEFREAEMERWEGLSSEEKAIWDNKPNIISESEYHRIGEEHRQSQTVPASCNHADIPYRPILAALFKGIPEFEQRYKLLDYYFTNFNDCASK